MWKRSNWLQLRKKMAKVQIKLPPKLVPVFAPARGSVAYRGAYGGRGSGKTFNFAKMAAVYSYREPLRVLCTRQYQTSIKESFHAELKLAIASEPWLEDSFDVGVDYIKGIGRHNKGTEYIFRGLEKNVNSVKSLAHIDLTIVEEAEDVPESSWLALEATVFRKHRSELWPIWNPRLKGSPVDTRFRLNKPASSIIVEMNYNDNPFFPVGLEELRARQQEMLDPNMYGHVWDGDYLTNSKSQVLAGKWKIEAFEPGADWNGPYQGGDFGFSQDPTAAVRCWIFGDNLFVEYEAGKVGLELDDMGNYICEHIPGFEKHTTRWDNARPESISHIKKPKPYSGSNFKVMPKSEAVAKWSGSVEDGVTFLRSFKNIVIHPRCTQTINEVKLYSYKVDKYTQEITTTIIDDNNHYIDAIRYAVTPLIKRKGGYTLADLQKAYG